MNIEDIHIGDMVRFRQWDDMEAEFGVNEDYIPCLFGFLEYMRSLCGMDFRVDEIRFDSILLIDESGLSPSEVLEKPVNISADMLELSNVTISFEPFEDEALSGLLGC